MKFQGELFCLLFAICFVDISRCNTTCPNGCDCSTDGMYDCSDRKLTTLVKVTDDIRTLDLSNNSIRQTESLDAPYLTYLSLDHNLLTTIAYDTFDNFDELKTLVLSNNKIKRITDDVFEWNPLKLEVLHLENNRLEFIQHFLLYDLEELTELYLQNNTITFIHSHAFLQLKKLRTIRLDGNHLYMFDSKWFRGLKANMFDEIRLDKNPWCCDCAMVPHAEWLKSKKAKWFKRLMKYDDLNCTRPKNQFNHRVRDLGQSKLEIQCDKPTITGISQNTTLHVDESIQLDCQIDNTTLPVPQIMWIAPNSDHYSLQTADRFEGIEIFQTGALIIRKVNVSDAGTYTCVATAHNVSVQAEMSLTVIPKVAGKPISKGIKDPDENTHVKEEIHNHDTICPTGCSCVALHVDCTPDNGQQELTEIPLADIPVTARSISLASNRISVVPVFTKQYPSLTELRLDDNKIVSISPKAFDNLKNLQTLTIRDNNLQNLPSNLFKNLAKLTILVLDNNQLTGIGSDTLRGLKSLQWLYIRHNLISKISSDAFSRLNDIKFIHLENNQLATLDKDTVMSLTEPKHHRPSIQKIFVDFNRFSCDCNMEALRLYLRASRPAWEALFGDGIQCSFPVDLHEKFMIDVLSPMTCNFTHVPEDVITVGGNSGGKKCHFPFEFQKKIYYKCIRANQPPFNSTVWCATTSSYTADGQWGACRTSDYTFVKIEKTENNQSGAFSGLWFAGLIVGFILCAVGAVLYKRYGNKLKLKSMTYSNIPGYDDMEEHRTLTTGGNNGTEAFV